MKTYRVTGDTFTLRAKIKKAGGSYNGDGSWKVTLFKSDAMKVTKAITPTDSRRELREYSYYHHHHTEQRGY